jgi:PhnB protein
MPQIQTYLNFDGTCAEALRFYEETLGGKIEGMMTFGDSPMADQMPPGSGDRVMHARLVVDGTTVMASDTMPGHPFHGMHGFGLALTYPTAEEAKRVFEALGVGGKIGMPLEKTFWAEAFGMLTDRFGTPWMVNGGMRPM